MGVITHGGIAGDIDREDAGELLDPLGGPLPAVLVAAAHEVIFAAQEGSAHTAADAVVPRGVLEGYECRAW